MTLRFLTLALVMGIASCVCAADGGTPENATSNVPEYGTPEPGRQILQKIEVPANPSRWNKGVDQLGEAMSADTAKEETLNYWLFLPKNYSADAKDGFPLLLFLHGAGERGPDPNNAKVHGPSKLVETEQGETWPFVTLSPQCVQDGYWCVDQLLILLDKVMAEYNIDPDRVYVTGLSMGGYGTWMLLDAAGDRFAAAAPLCGGCNPAKAGKMVDIPIWIFHGAVDSVVPPERSQVMYDAIKKLGGEKVKLTMYPGVDHGCWVPAYNDPELYKWFLEQKRTDR